MVSLAFLLLLGMPFGQPQTQYVEFEQVVAELVEADEQVVASYNETCKPQPSCRRATGRRGVLGYEFIYRALIISA